MQPRGIELILMRQLASCLAMPIAILDAKGDIIYCNDSAEKLLGLRMNGYEPMSSIQVARLLDARDLDGVPLDAEELPMRFAVENSQPTHRQFCIRGLDGVGRCLAGTAFPLVNGVGEHVGTVSVFWEISG
jgi:PAS domain-containing protein